MARTHQELLAEIIAAKTAEPKPLSDILAPAKAAARLVDIGNRKTLEYYFDADIASAKSWQNPSQIQASTEIALALDNIAKSLFIEAQSLRSALPIDSSADIDYWQKKLAQGIQHWEEVPALENPKTADERTKIAAKVVAAMREAFKGKGIGDVGVSPW